MTMGTDARQRERGSLLRFAGASGSLVGLFVIGMVIMSIMATRAG